MIEFVHGTGDDKRVSGEVFTAVSNAAQKLRPQGSIKLTYIYTSGTWVHGDNRNEVVTDTTPNDPITSPVPDLVKWRPIREQIVINDKTLNGFVIRPGLMYGSAGPLLARFFQEASKGQVWYPGTPGSRLALLHTDDLGDIYVKAVEKSALCGGLIFDAVNDHTESVDDLLAALIKVSGAKGPYEYRAPTNCVFFFDWIPP